MLLKDCSKTLKKPLASGQTLLISLNSEETKLVKQQLEAEYQVVNACHKINLAWTSLTYRSPNF